MPRKLAGKTKGKKGGKKVHHPRAWLKRNYGLAQPNRRLDAGAAGNIDEDCCELLRSARAQSMPDPDTLALAGASPFATDALPGREDQIRFVARTDERATILGGGSMLCCRRRSRIA